jgi:hypothetical protein
MAAVVLLLAVLPTSPFGIEYEMPEFLRNILGYINWVIPFAWIADTLLAWALLIFGYYAVQMVLRWTKAL